MTITSDRRLNVPPEYYYAADPYWRSPNMNMMMRAQMEHAKTVTKMEKKERKQSACRRSAQAANAKCLSSSDDDRLDRSLLWGSASYGLCDYARKRTRATTRFGGLRGRAIRNISGMALCGGLGIASAVKSTYASKAVNIEFCAANLNRTLEEECRK